MFIYYSYDAYLSLKINCSISVKYHRSASGLYDYLFEKFKNILKIEKKNDFNFQ